MPTPSPLSRILLGSTLVASAALSPAWGQERGVLVVHSSPDSAVVVLDGAPDAERQKTPYRNETMIPGKHVVVVRPSNAAQVAGRYEIVIPPGETVALRHVFAYRTKAHGMEALSIAPWTLQVATGFEYHRYLGFAPASSPDSAAGKAKSLDFESYPSDSQPSSMHLPVELRLGLPAAFEARFSYPFAGRTESDGSSDFGLSDVGIGLKWTATPINTALDAHWKFGNAARTVLGERSHSLALSVATNQRWKFVDILGHAGWRGIFTDLDDDLRSPGDEFFLRLRGGVLLADRFLPNLGLSAAIRTPDSYDGEDGDPSWSLTATPGFILYAGRSFDWEAGIPITPLASNAETSWGLRTSLALRMGIASDHKRPRAAAASVVGPVYGGTRLSAPVPTPVHILIDAREITNAEYKAFCDKTGRSYPRDPDLPGMPGYFTEARFANHPVVNVSIEDARAYAEWVGKRLPTVAEWKKEFQDSNVPASAIACGLDAPEEVGSRDQGAGFRHFLGNVAEWVENDRTTGSTAYIAGGFFSLPKERCLEKARWIDLAAPTGAKYIGFRLVTEVK